MNAVRINQLDMAAIMRQQLQQLNQIAVNTGYNKYLSRRVDDIEIRIGNLEDFEERIQNIENWIDKPIAIEELENITNTDLNDNSIIGQ